MHGQPSGPHGGARSRARSRPDREQACEKSLVRDPQPRETHGFRRTPCGMALASYSPEVSAMDGSSLLLIRGIVGVVIGIVAFAWPGVTIAALVVIFGIYALIDGVTNLMLGLTRRAAHGRSWVHALQGIRGIAAGAMTFILPPLTAPPPPLFLASWSIL